MVERIKEILQRKNMSPSQFADEIGIQRSGMSHIISGRNKPSLEFVLKVLKRFPDITPEYLLQGEIPSVEERIPFSSEKEDSAPTLFDAADPASVPETKKLVRQTIRKEEKNPEKTIEKVVILYNDRTFREYYPD